MTMIDQKKCAYHFETSLLPLKLILIEAEKESPPHVRKEWKDVNEELALKLIGSVKKKYKRFVFKPRSPDMECNEYRSIKKETVLEP